MCGRYYIDHETFQLVQQQCGVEEDEECEAGDMVPGQKIPILYQSEGHLKMDTKSWGYTHPRYKGRTINAKCETIFEKYMFQKDIYTHRCLIPAKGFYEWDPLKHKFSFENKKHQPIYFAGLYHGDEVVIITTHANSLMSPIHNRMPLIIQQVDIYDWLCHDDKAFEMIKRLRC